MAKIFLDANYFINLIKREPQEKVRDALFGNLLYLSALSIHIYCYVYKIKLPDENVLIQVAKFQLVELSSEIVNRALQGPTNDFEDNVQLHSAAEAECDIFLTEDKKLLDMKFFGKVKITSSN